MAILLEALSCHLPRGGAVSINIGGLDCHRRVFFFSSLSSLKNYSLTLFVAGFSTLVLILWFQIFVLCHFVEVLFVFNFILQFQFTKYYIFQFSSYSFNFYFFFLNVLEKLLFFLVSSFNQNFIFIFDVNFDPYSLDFFLSFF